MKWKTKIRIADLPRWKPSAIIGKRRGVITMGNMVYLVWSHSRERRFDGTETKVLQKVFAEAEKAQEFCERNAVAELTLEVEPWPVVY